MAKELVKTSDDLSVWNSNIRQLAQRQPQLAAVLEDYVQKNGHSLAHYEEHTPAGTWVEGLTKEPFFQADGDPEISWTKRDRNTPVFFQYGCGLPPYLFKSIRELPKEAMSIIVVEPELPLLAYVLHMTNVYAAIPQGTALIFITEPDEVPAAMRLVRDDGTTVDSDETPPVELLWRAIRDEGLTSSLTVQGLFTAGMSKVTIHPGEERAYGKRIASTAHSIREWVLTSLNYLGNSSHDTMIGLRQMSLMSPWIVYGYSYESLLKDFKGRPFVIVSAGPSLSKNMEQLRGLEEKCVILANDATLGKLLRAGIRPHVVCALERGLPTYNLLFADVVREFPEECSKILLVSQAVSTCKIYGTWPGPKIIVGKNEIPVDKWFVETTLQSTAIQSGTSVAHMCFGIASSMGASSVALIGQDLAYGDDGASHSGGIFSEKTMERTNKNAINRRLYKVESVDGGTVDTSEVWLSFLRLFETRTVVAPFPVYDCTEGGALIKGTTIIPFAEYIKNNVTRKRKLKTTPAEVVQAAGTCRDRAARFAELKDSFAAADRDIDIAGHLIERLAEGVSRVSAPGLAPKARIAIAAGVAQTLDELNHVNPMFAFIAQSYLYLATAEVATSRFLDSVEMVERWVSIHREIIEGHVTVLRFIREMVDYARDALAWYVDHDLRFDPMDPDRTAEIFADIVERLGDGEDQTALRCEMDSLFTFADVARDGDWEGEPLWQCANFLLKEGRSQEAGVLMNKAASLFEDKEMPVDTIKAFMKDQAKISLTPDLCYLPRYAKARQCIQNAEVYGPDDDTRALRLELAEREQGYMIDIAMLFGSYKREYLSKWYAMREAAQEMLEHGDHFGAFKTIWQGVKLYGREIPRVCGSHLVWLVRQLEKFFDSEDAETLAQVGELMEEAAHSMDLFRVMGTPLTMRFIQEMTRHGARVDVVRETETAVG